VPSAPRWDAARSVARASGLYGSQGRAFGRRAEPTVAQLLGRHLEGIALRATRRDNAVAAQRLGPVHGPVGSHDKLPDGSAVLGVGGRLMRYRFRNGA